MNKIKVSMIIPVYNGAEFIRRSFDSCIYQTLKEIEVIAVNDFSPNPRDAEIMREYEELYPGRFRALFHETNKRQGGARNTGIHAARGEYFLCVDQDDYIDFDMCDKMYNKAIQSKADLCICGYKIYSNGNTSKIPPVLCTIEYMNTGTAEVWKILVKTSFVISNGAYFPENLVTDDLISILWFALTDKYVIVDDVFYNWVRHKNSESMRLAYRFFVSIPASLLSISRYSAFITLPNEKKEEMALIITHYLCDVVLSCLKHQPKRITEICSLVKETLEIYKPNFLNEIFTSTTYGIRYSSILKYVCEHYNEKCFAKKLDVFSDTLIAKLIKEELLFKYNAEVSIAIYGAGIRGKRLAGYLYSADIPFEVTDSNPALYGHEFCGRIIKPWSELKRSTNVVIVSPLGEFDKIKAIINDSSIDIIDFLNYNVIKN